ncbi:helix-turn-helix domain-containing protein [Brachybacterium sp. AOP25-B2-12]|uniref:helix-turn-helix domain-containing protein n=1 Tax=Brachybacterium sp. AOP25-B2-12 TaxID=3457710 RepID=UPI004033B922
MSPYSPAAAVPENAERFLGHPMHVHDCPHLVIVLSGSGVLSTHHERVELPAQHSVWLRAGVWHELSLTPGSMAFGPMLADDVTPASDVRALGRSPRLHEIVLGALTAAPRDPRQLEPFRAALGDALRGVTRDPFGDALPAHPAVRALAQEAVRCDAHLDVLAARHRLSPRQVQRVFRAELGTTFSLWRSRARLDHAARQLEAGWGLTSAARRSGYGTRTGLLRAIARETGADIAAVTADPLGHLRRGARRAEPERASA